MAFREGRKAEEQKDYDSAVVDFRKALQAQPDNTRLLLYEKQARTEASLAHLERGREWLKANRVEPAAGEFQKAVSIDPGNQAAAQELRQVVTRQATAATQRENAIRKAMEAEEQPEASGVQLKRLSRSIIPELGALGYNPPTTTSSGTPYLNLNQLGKIGTKDFSVVLSGVVANALLTDNRTHILQSPQIRVTAGQKATLKIGEQVPYATGSFGVPTSSASSSSSLLTNTQFNYKDTGVDLIMQPFVAALLLASELPGAGYGSIDHDDPALGAVTGLSDRFGRFSWLLIVSRGNTSTEPGIYGCHA